MTWVRLDDHFPDHPKVVKAGPLAGWLHICGIAYCNRHLTDGFIPESVAYRLADFEHIGIALGGGEMFEIGEDASCEWMTQILCAEKLWKKVKGGFKIHDYLHYQPSKAQVLSERAKTRNRVAEHRTRKRNAPVTLLPTSLPEHALGNAPGNAVSNGPVTGAPYPVVEEGLREEPSLSSEEPPTETVTETTARDGDGDGWGFQPLEANSELQRLREAQA